jgi:hypothetical protein
MFDVERYRDLRTRHGVYTSGMLAVHWSVPFIIVPLLVGIPLSRFI